MKIKHQLRYSSHPIDAKAYDTARLREEFHIPVLFETDTIMMVYTMYDRLIVGGAMPVGETLRLEAIPELKADHFLDRREIGIYNVGGPGRIKIGEQTFELTYKEALYLGRGNRELLFESLDAGHPAKFYFNSAPAHRTCPDRKITKADAISVELGSLEASNHRVVNKMLVAQVIDTCQLQMGMTELKPGSVWNTMPAHTHSRRMEAYFYFDIPQQDVVCHFLGEPNETRHIWMKGEQAVLSPQWSIHSACATHNYTFIWGMAGENLDYDDMDKVENIDLK